MYSLSNRGYYNIQSDMGRTRIFVLDSLSRGGGSAGQHGSFLCCFNKKIYILETNKIIHRRINNNEKIQIMLKITGLNILVMSLNILYTKSLQY